MRGQKRRIDPYSPRVRFLVVAVIEQLPNHFSKMLGVHREFLGFLTYFDRKLSPIGRRVLFV